MKRTILIITAIILIAFTVSCSHIKPEEYYNENLEDLEIIVDIMRKHDNIRSVEKCFPGEELLFYFSYYYTKVDGIIITTETEEKVELSKEEIDIIKKHLKADTSIDCTRENGFQVSFQTYSPIDIVGRNEFVIYSDSKENGPFHKYIENVRWINDNWYVATY